MEIYSLINRLIKYSLKNSLITEDDVMFVRNELMALLQLKDWRMSMRITIKYLNIHKKS